MENPAQQTEKSIEKMTSIQNNDELNTKGQEFKKSTPIPDYLNGIFSKEGPINLLYKTINEKSQSPCEGYANINILQ